MINKLLLSFLLAISTYFVDAQVLPGLRAGISTKIASSSYDTDAQAFFDAAGITDNTQKAAINDLILDLKSNSLWSLGKGIYPIVGGTATTHKYNLKDPRDLDAAFRLSFQGGWTHASTGMTPNGTTGYARTFFIPTTQQADALGSVGVYCRINVDEDKSVIEANSNFNGQVSKIQTRSFNSTVFSLASASPFTTGNADSRGWFFVSRTGATASFGQINSTQTSTNTAAIQNPSVEYYVGARNIAGSADKFSTNQIAFVWIGSSLSTTQASTLYTIIQDYQTALSRQL